MGGHVLVECMSSGWHILQYVVFCWKTCLTGGHVFLRICIIGGHVLQFEISYVLLEGISYRKPCIA